MKNLTTTMTMIYNIYVKEVVHLKHVYLLIKDDCDDYDDEQPQHISQPTRGACPFLFGECRRLKYQAIMLEHRQCQRVSIVVPT